VPDISGWVPMRTVAEVRRELGVGAPREKNSLYRPIERGPRKFNPLRIPKQLQVRAAGLPPSWRITSEMFLCELILLTFHDGIQMCSVYVYS
jgi:hypothetical protein